MIPHLNICVESPGIAAEILRNESQANGNMLVLDRGSKGYLFIACQSVDDASELRERWSRTATLPAGIATIEVALSGTLLIVRQHGVESQERLARYLAPFIEHLRTLSTVMLIDDDTGMDVSNASNEVLFGDEDFEGE